MRGIESPLGQDEVLERLAAFGKDWRESTLPESVRRRLIFDCSLVVSGRTLTMLIGNSAHRYFSWHGDVSVREGGGSIVHLQWQLAPLGWVVSAVPLVAYVWMRWTQGFDQAISWGLFAAVGVAGTLAWEKAMQGSMCIAILDHVIGMQSVTSLR